MDAWRRYGRFLLRGRQADRIRFGQQLYLVPFGVRDAGAQC